MGPLEYLPCGAHALRVAGLQPGQQREQAAVYSPVTVPLPECGCASASGRARATGSFLQQHSVAAPYSLPVGGSGVAPAPLGTCPGCPSN